MIRIYVYSEEKKLINVLQINEGDELNKIGLLESLDNGTLLDSVSDFLFLNGKRKASTDASFLLVSFS